MVDSKPNKILGALPLLLAIAVIVALMAWALTRPAGFSGNSALIGKPARDFSVAFLSGDSGEGGKVSLAHFKGRPLVLNFWASWCSSCRSEAHAMEAFWREHHAKVAVVGIAVQDSAEAVREAIQAQGKTYTIGLDEDGGASVDYGVTGVPETFFIDASGIVRHKTAGPLDSAELAKMLEMLTAAGMKETR